VKRNLIDAAKSGLVYSIILAICRVVGFLIFEREVVPELEVLIFLLAFLAVTNIKWQTRWLG